MNELKALQSMGLVLPSPAYLLGAIVFGLLGMVAFSRGRKTKQPVLTWSGIILMLYPYAIGQTWLLWSVGLGLTALVFAKWKFLAKSPVFVLKQNYPNDSLAS